jgi:NAD(P)-dependent dehydrogenase (short-subunit alcohol dehydrogenase family)
VWDRTFAVNARGTMLVARGALPLMLETGGGSIINIASAAGLWGDVRSTAYGSSKAAVIGLTRYIAAQHMNSGLRCNAIAPGVIATPAAGVLPPPVMETVTRHQMRLGEPEDIAGVVLFLASDLSAFVTGQVITVDGGLLVHSPMMPERAAMLRAASSENAEP